MSTAPAARLISHSQGSRSATVAVVEGSASTQTVVTFTNSFEIGQLKLCKVAGTGLATGINFVFMVGARAVNVPAGPAPGGFCSVAGSFPAGTDLSITESPSAGASVTAIEVEPADRLRDAADIAGGQVNVSIGAGATEVTFTNRATVATTTTTTPTRVAPTTTTPPAPTTTTPTTRPLGGWCLSRAEVLAI